MAKKHGKCSNIGNCDYADSKKVVEILDGQEFVCTNCGKGLNTAVSPVPSSIDFFKILKIGVPIIAIICVFFLVKNVFTNDTAPPSVADNHVSRQPLENANKFKDDPIVSLKGIKKEIYFLNKSPFLSAAKKSNRNLKSIDDFRELLTNYLVTESILVQEVFGADSAILWSYIAKNNPDVINATKNSIGRSKKVHQIDYEWGSLLVYNTKDKVLPKTNEPNIYPSSDTTTTKQKPEPIASIPKRYKAIINGKAKELLLKNFSNTGDFLNFTYEITGLANHYNISATLNTKTSEIEMNSLGKAKLLKNSDGTVSILIADGNHNFTSIY